MEKFVEQVKAARELLDFAISEGSERLEDGVIRDINAAVDSIRNGNPPSSEARIKFEKAYRDLVKILYPVTVDALRISSWPRWAKPLATLGVFLAFIVVNYLAGMKLGWVSILIVAATASIFIAYVAWFLDLFTGVVRKQRMIQIVLFCYVFTILALLGSVLPFFGWSFTPTEKLEKVYQAMLQSPMGIVKGCNRLSKGSDDWVSKEIKCDNQSYQWVINVGGTVSRPTGVKGKSGAKSKSRGRGVGVTQTKLSPVDIHGGLVVPLYVVVLSLIGGAVSMTRRVPEIQERVYRLPGDENHIPREQARKLLVFQILQVISAPLIAVTAYYLAKPDTRAVSVALGFASGFASETILQSIRALLGKLTMAEIPPSAKPPEQEAATAPSPRVGVLSPSSPTQLGKTKGTTLPIKIETIPEGEAVDCKVQGDNDGKLEQARPGEFVYERGSAPDDTVTLTFKLTNYPDVTEKLEVRPPEL